MAKSKFFTPKSLIFPRSSSRTPGLKWFKSSIVLRAKGEIMFRFWHQTLVVGLVVHGLMIQAGNRADVNADQHVDAGDLSILANILAGNLALENYDLHHVVVVAPQGGDFTDPADAADWVNTQDPDWLNRFVILVTPGLYFLDRPLMLPNYTTLLGQDSTSCTIRRDTQTSNGEPSDSAVVVIEAPTAFAGIESVTIENNGTLAGSQFITGVFVSRAAVTMRDVVIHMMTDGGIACGLYAETFTGISRAKLLLIDCRLQIAGDNGSSVFGIYNDSSEVVLHNSSIKAYNNETNKNSFAIFAAENDYCPASKAYHSVCRVLAEPPGVAYYIYEFGDGSSALYFSVLYGISKGTIVHGYCVDGAGSPVP